MDPTADSGGPENAKASRATAPTVSHEASMTVVPNPSEAERARLPGGRGAVRLSWAPEHMQVVRETEASLVEGARGELTVRERALEPELATIAQGGE